MKLKLCVLFSLAFALFTAACNPAQKQAARSALDDATAACEGMQASVIVQRDQTGKIVNTVCTYEEEVAPLLEGVLSAHKAGAKYHPSPASSGK